MIGCQWSVVRCRSFRCEGYSKRNDGISMTRRSSAGGGFPAALEMTGLAILAGLRVIAIRSAIDRVSQSMHLARREHARLPGLEVAEQERPNRTRVRSRTLWPILASMRTDLAVAAFADGDVQRAALLGAPHDLDPAAPGLETHALARIGQPDCRASALRADRHARNRPRARDTFLRRRIAGA
jgi:hypothetical protein